MTKARPRARPAILGKWRDTYCLWVAQGFGLGRIPFMPGTFGSLAGLLWFALLLKTGHFWSYLLGIALGFTVSVWLCGKGEKLLGQTDPGSVVLDEITAIPVCFLSFVTVPLFETGQFPTPESFFTGPGWWLSAIVFVLFRVFDILKPWPVRGSQKLPGGWGVTVDDFLAGIYVALLTLPVALR
jgi:phosphatidylglycerophosphatase A